MKMSEKGSKEDMADLLERGSTVIGAARAAPKKGMRARRALTCMAEKLGLTMKVSYMYTNQDTTGRHLEFTFSE